MKHFTIFFYFVFIFILLSSSIAQTSKMSIEGKPKKSTSEIVGVRDDNGRFCAAIKVLSDMDGFKYQSNNGVIKVDDMPGRDMVYLSPDERVLEIYHSGYEMFRVILSEYGIQLHPKEVWIVRIKGAPKTGSLLPVTFLLQPKDAIITIDGKRYQSGLVVKLSKGSHRLIIEKQGFKKIEKTINISENNVFFNYTLSEIDLQPVQIKSVPSGARIYINSIEKGATDDGYFLYLGEYRLTLTKTGYLEVNETITVTEGLSTGPGQASNIFSYNLTKNSGSLNLTVNPARAKVLINKEDYSNRSQIDLAPGRYKIEISKIGYYPQSETITVDRGQIINKDFILIAKTGKLQFKVKPFNARVTLKQNGRTVKSWTGMKYIKDLPVGNYELECRASGYATQTKYLTIEEQQTAVLDVKLTYLTKTMTNKNNHAFVKSLFVPGWGQISNGHKRGWFYTITFVGATGWYIAAYSTHSKNMDVYNSAKNIFDNDPTFENALAVNYAVNKTDQSYKNGMAALYVLGGVYAINLIDALLFSSKKGTKTYSIKPYLNRSVNAYRQQPVFGLIINW